MTATSEPGPSIIYGDMLSIPGASESNSDAGPSVTYQGGAVPDVRFTLKAVDLQLGSIVAHLDSPYFLLVDAVPSASTATPSNIAAAANVTSGTAMVLAAAAVSGVTPGVPLYQFGTNTLITALALDFGFVTAACVAGSKTVTLTASLIATNYFYAGQWLAIGAVGNAGGTSTLFTQIVTVNAATLTVSIAPLATNAAAPLGNCNIPGVRFGSPVPTAVFPYAARGVTSLLNPAETLARGIGIQGTAGGSGGAFLVKGYDIYGRPVSELITATAGATTTYGNKCFKYIASVTPQFTNAFNYSIGTSDVFEFAVRNDKWEYDNIYVAGAFLSVNTGWTAADTTTPATTTTKSVTGTIQIGTRGPLGSGAAGGPTDGAKRLAVFVSIPYYNLLQATPNNPVPMYGVTPA